MKSIFNQISRHIVFLLLKRAQNNCLQITLINSNKLFYFGKRNQNPVAKISIHDESLFRDLLLNPGIGLAEGYMHFIQKIPFLIKMFRNIKIRTKHIIRHILGYYKN